MIHRSTRLALALLLAPAGIAHAQDSAAVVLDTVSVLGAPVPALRAPFGVSVVREAEIRRGRPGLGLTEALAAVPGVQVDNRFNYALGERISVRGLGARAQFGVRGVRVLVDGIPATLPDGQTTLNHVDPAALGRAEIIRGPASALYGNASGGVLHLSTAPAPDAPIASEHRIVAGAHGLLRAESSIGGRAGAASYRVYASRLEYEGYRAHASAENLNAGGSLHLAARRGRAAPELHRRPLRCAEPRLAERLAAARGPLRRVCPQRGAAHGRGGAAGAGGRVVAAADGSRRRSRCRRTGSMRSIDNPIPNAVIDLDRRRRAACGRRGRRMPVRCAGPSAARRRRSGTTG